MKYLVRIRDISGAETLVEWSVGSDIEPLEETIKALARAFCPTDSKMEYWSFELRKIPDENWNGNRYNVRPTLELQVSQRF